MLQHQKTWTALREAQLLMGIRGCSPGGRAGLWWVRTRQDPPLPPELFSVHLSPSAASSRSYTAQLKLWGSAKGARATSLPQGGVLRVET